ncbi:MAG: alpha/beta hydrolase [Candidatus Obscuribacterales bacterium]|nr:alpha/beta hydrolase [Steroidobacteraceae bacterium]
MNEDRSVLTRPAKAPDQTICYGDESDQLADVWFGNKTPAERPLVIFIHGGFWRPAYDRTHAAPLAEAIARAGWTIASMEYRRTPGIPDRTLHDVNLGIDKLPSLVPQHSGRTILLGHSAGGHLVLWAAARRAALNPFGAIALAPAADLQFTHDRGLGDNAVLAFLGVAPTTRTDVDPAQLNAPNIPVTIVHGTDDAIVPLAISESYLSKHPKARLVRIANAGHFAVIDPLSSAWPHVIEELARII